MSTSKSLLIRIFQAIQRRGRHLRILYFARNSSIDAISFAKRLDRVLVLCYGNIYRSPLVEYLLKRRLSDQQIEIKSAGFHDKAGRSCVEEYLDLLAKRGYDLKDHRSSKVTQSDIDWADIIILMDRKNWDLMSQMDQSAVEKVVWIGGVSTNESVEVVDPYGMGVEATEQVISQLETCVSDIADQITEKRSAYEGHLEIGGKV